jgi:hypothetical protein
VIPKLDPHGIQYPSRSIDSDAVILVAPVARHLGLVTSESFGTLPLSQSKRNAQGNQGMPQPVQVDQFVELPTSKALVPPPPRRSIFQLRRQSRPMSFCLTPGDHLSETYFQVHRGAQIVFETTTYQATHVKQYK